MDEFLTRVFHDLVGRMDGPMKLRLLLQPLVACVFAIRAGLRDAREGSPPFFWALFFHAEHRRALLREGWKDVAKVFVAAMILDAIYQVIALHKVYPGEAVIVAVVLAIIPYLLVRAPVTRLFGKKKDQP